LRKSRDIETLNRWVMLVSLLLLLPHRSAAELKIRPPFQPDPAQTIHLQRTLTLLMNSRPNQRNPVRVLFYGQSISLQEWWLQVAAYLRNTYPHADLTIENRSISNMQSDALARTAYADVIPHQPDLIIFHAMAMNGARTIPAHHPHLHHGRRPLLGDHVVDSGWRDDETDPEKVLPSTPGRIETMSAAAASRPIWGVFRRNSHGMASLLAHECAA
jgi:hypothetical protein